MAEWHIYKDISGNVLGPEKVEELLASITKPPYSFKTKLSKYAINTSNITLIEEPILGYRCFETKDGLFEETPIYERPDLEVNLKGDNMKIDWYSGLRLQRWFTLLPRPELLILVNYPRNMAERLTEDEFLKLADEEIVRKLNLCVRSA